MAPLTIQKLRRTHATNILRMQNQRSFMTYSLGHGAHHENHGDEFKEALVSLLSAKEVSGP